MKHKLPRYVEPTRLANNRQTLSGVLSLAEMPRLAESLPAQDQEIETCLQFGRDDGNRVVIEIHIRATLLLECQRTLKTYSQDFDITTTLCPITHDSEAKLLPQGYEPLLLHDDQITTVDLVEDELLLALPIVPKQQDNDCAQTDNQAYYADSENDEIKNSKKEREFGNK